MSTAPVMTESPLNRLLDGAVSAEAQPANCADPYARWHGFMARAVRNNVVVATVSQLLTQRPRPAWALDGAVGGVARRTRR